MAKKDFNFILNKGQLPKIQRNIAVRLSEMANKHFNRSFDRGGFTDQTLIKWQPSKRERDGRGKTLIDRGDLRRSIRPVQQNYRQSRIISDRPYSARHNDGLAGMPQRQFMGTSAVLNKVSCKIIIEELNKIFIK